MRHAAIQKKSTKGPHFIDDDCTLSVYLSLLVYVFMLPSLPPPPGWTKDNRRTIVNMLTHPI